MKKLLFIALLSVGAYSHATTTFRGLDCLELQEACACLRNDPSSSVRASGVMCEAIVHNQKAMMDELLAGQREILAKLPQ